MYLFGYKYKQKLPIIYRLKFILALTHINIVFAIVLKRNIKELKVDCGNCGKRIKYISHYQKSIKWYDEHYLFLGTTTYKKCGGKIRKKTYDLIMEGSEKIIENLIWSMEIWLKSFISNDEFDKYFKSGLYNLEFKKQLLLNYYLRWILQSDMISSNYFPHIWIFISSTGIKPIVSKLYALRQFLVNAYWSGDLDFAILICRAEVNRILREHIKNKVKILFHNK